LIFVLFSPFFNPILVSFSAPESPMNQSRTTLIVVDEDPLLRLWVRVFERVGDILWSAPTGLGSV
jgi:hypothetical protein